MPTKKYKIKGLTPAMQHNGRLANPMDEVAIKMKAITSKRKKTEEDFLELARLEFFGSFYLDGEGKVIWPAEAIDAMLIEGAKKNRLGKQFKASVFCVDVPGARLKFDGPQDPQKRWEKAECRDYRSVKIKQSRTMRCRPIFQNWSLEFTVNYESVEESDVDAALVEAGDRVGLSEYRPRYGRFIIE